MNDRIKRRGGVSSNAMQGMHSNPPRLQRHGIVFAGFLIGFTLGLSAAFAVAGVDIPTGDDYDAGYDDGFHDGWHEGAGWLGHVFDPWTIGGPFLIIVPLVGLLALGGLVHGYFKVKKQKEAAP